MNRAASFLLLFFFVQLAGGALSARWWPEGGDEALTRTMLAAETAALAATALFCAVRKRVSWLPADDFSVFSPVKCGDAAALLGLVLTLSIGTACVLQPFGLDDGGSTLRFAALARRWEAALLFCVAGPVFEEVVFRYGLADGLCRALRSEKRAVVLSAAVFGAVHLNWLQGFSAFVMGCAFGALYFGRRSLLLPVAAHILCNTLAFASLRYPAAEASAAALPGLLLAGVGLALCAASAAGLYKKLSQR